MTFMQRLEDRWDRRRGAEPFNLDASITIDASPETVWQFITAPESAVVTSNDVVKVFHVPGTPLDQPGEQMVLLREADGYVVAELHEAVVVEPVARVVTVCRSAPFENWSARTLERAQLGGTVLRTQVSVALSNDPARAQLVVRETEKVMWEELRRTKRAIESGVQFPSQRDGQ